MKTTINREKVLSILLSVFLVAGTMSVPANADENTATFMKLTSTEGKVTVSNGLGRKMSPFNGMNLNNGYHVLTEESSVARINMDDTKLATVGELSDVDISKQGEDLELRLNDGDVFVSVNKKVAKTATVKVRTANVVMGITGTHVGIFVDPATGKIVLTNTDGIANIGMRDHTSGRYASYSLSGGRVLEFDSPALDRAVMGGGNTNPGVYATLRQMTSADVTPALADAAKNQPEVLENASEGVKDLDLTDPSEFKGKLDESVKRAQEAVGGSADSASGTAGTEISAAFAAQEEEVKKAETKAAEEAEKSRHRHHDDDDDDENCTHGQWGAHSMPAISRSGAGTDMTYSTGRSFSISVTCGLCGRSVSHAITVTPQGGVYDPDYGESFSWQCTTCGASGTGHTEN